MKIGSLKKINKIGKGTHTLAVWPQSLHPEPTSCYQFWQRILKNPW